MEHKKVMMLVSIDLSAVFWYYWSWNTVICFGTNLLELKDWPYTGLTYTYVQGNLKFAVVKSILKNTHLHSLLHKDPQDLIYPVVFPVL